MSHIVPREIHVFANRAQDLRISIETAELTTDFSAIEFTGGPITKTPLSADDTPTGFDVDFTLTASDLSIDTGLYDWELTAVLAGEKRRIHYGKLKVDA